MARNLRDGTLRVMMRVGLVAAALALAAEAVLPDFRRSLDAAALLLEGAIAAGKIAST
jgi:hypothetical protein